MGRKLAYLNAIREISVASHHTPVVVPCDWLHQQMIKQSRTKTIERGQEEHEHLGENRDVAKSMDQVYKDLKRDKLILNGEEFTCPDGNNILNILYHSIMENRDIKSSLEVTPSTTTHAQDARDAIAFARTILLGSVRTVCGGEAYDAVTFMFHDTDFVMICPDATQTYPLKLTVNRRNSLDEEDSFFERSSKAFGLLNLRSRKSGGSSTSDLKSSLKKCNSVNSMTRNGRKSHYSQLHEKWTTSPKRSKGLNGKTSQSSPNILKGGSGLSTHREQIQNKEAQGTIWPEVTIEAESTFKIMALDPEDTLIFICTCRIQRLIETIRKDPLANLFFVCERYNPTTVTADAPASRIDKKKSSPENCIFFLPIRFHLTLILKLQRRIACPIILLP